MAALVLVSAVRIKLIVPIEALPAEAAFGVPLKAALVDRTRVVVAELFVLFEFCEGEELMLVGKDFFIPRAKATITCELQVQMP